MKECDTLMCLFNGQKSWRIHKVIQEFEVASGLYQCDSCFKDIVIEKRHILRKEQS
jgi:hypothetical protein